MPVHGQKYPQHEVESKGSVFGGVCNRTACDTGFATMYNRVTFGYYCWACAKGINYDPREPKLCVEVTHDLTIDEMNVHYSEHTAEFTAHRRASRT